MKYFLFLALFSCAHRELKLTAPLKEGLVSVHKPSQPQARDSLHPTLISVWKSNFWQMQNGGDLLQNTQKASASIRFRLKEMPQNPQDLLAISVGSLGVTYSSRFSIRLQNSQFMGILRAGDNEAPQEVFTTGAAIRVGNWHVVTMTVDYSTNKASFYLDGHKLETKSSLKFTQKQTSDTPSASMAIGAEDDGHANFFLSGEISEVLIWRRELSWEEIKQL